MMRLIAVAALVVGCGGVGELGGGAPLELAAASLSVTSETLGFAAGEGAAKLTGDVLARWEAATCLDLRVSADGPHAVLLTEEGYSTRTRAGQTSGTWEAATIRVRPSLPAPKQAIVLRHEIAHLLALTNEHQRESVMSADEGFAASNQFISSALLARICTVRDCGCFAPER